MQKSVLLSCVLLSCTIVYSQSDDMVSIMKKVNGNVKQITITRCEIKEKKGTKYVTNDCEKEVVVYDSTGKILNYTKSENQKQVDRMTYKYDSLGNLIEKIDYDQKDSIDSRELFTYQYDSSGRITQSIKKVRTKYYKDYVKREKILYDENMNIIECIESDDHNDSKRYKVDIVQQ